MNYRTGYTGNWGQQMETKEHAITDLLEQWAELEPERFTLLGDPVDVLADVYAKIDGVEWNLSSKDYGPDRYVIQGAVQEAIEARGLSYRHTSYVNENGVRIHHVTIYQRKHYPDYIDNLKYASCDGHDACTAFLRAHVSALREVKEDE